MGRLVVTEYVTLDGVMEAPGGGEDFEHAGWTFRTKRGPDGDAFKFDETKRSAALLFGRVTYEGMAAVWPHMAGEFADMFNALPKFVVSRTLTDALWNNTEVLGGDLVEDVTRLKERFDGDIVVHGSGTLVHALLEHDLLDELRLMVFPLVLGSGKRLFSTTPTARRFRLASSTIVGEGVAIQIHTPIYDFAVSRDMAVGVSDAWRAWTEPNRYGEWFGAVPGTVRLDPRPGGEWSMELDDSPNGRLSGTYVDVVPEKRLVMTTRFDSGDTVMEMLFSATDTGSRIEIRQDSDTPSGRDGARAGSEYLLDRCASYLAPR